MINGTRVFFFLLILFISTPLFAQDETVKLEAPLFDNLGHFEHPIHTKNPMAQRFFNQGMIFFYGFEWGESIRSFKEATRLDPRCAMCYWGLALSLTYQANEPMTGHEYQDALQAIHTAAKWIKENEVHEKAYVQSLALLLSDPPSQPLPVGPFSCHTNGGQKFKMKNIKNYSDALNKIILQFPQDEDAKALYVLAMLDRAEWKFWDLNGKMEPLTPTILNTLQVILAKQPLNMAANHYYIHVIEQSPQPEQGIKNAERLKTLVPGSEHLLHMPSHIYFLTGNFQQAVLANQAAIEAYKNYIEFVTDQGFKPVITYLNLHNYDFLRIAASRQGNSELALSAASQLSENLKFEQLKRDSYLQWFIPIHYFVLARFGKWDEIFKQPIPPAKYGYALGMWHYASGIALAYSGFIEPAVNEVKHLDSIIKKRSLDAVLGKTGLQMLMIAREMLEAVISSMKENEKETITHLKKAISLQKSSEFDDPPDWYFPIEEALGYAYLRWGHLTEAKEMFEADLKQNPKNGWALFGLANTLRRLKENAQAKQVEKEFKKAWVHADIDEPFTLF